MSGWGAPEAPRKAAHVGAAGLNIAASGSEPSCWDSPLAQAAVRTSRVLPEAGGRRPQPALRRRPPGAGWGSGGLAGTGLGAMRP